MRKAPAVLASFVALVALVVGLTGCGGVQATAATVNGHRISEDTIDEELRQIQSNKRYRDAIGLGSIDGAGRDGTFDAEFAARVLTLTIYYELVQQELDDRGLELTDDDLAAARRSAEASLSGALNGGGEGDSAEADGRRVLGGFSDDYRDTLVRREAMLTKLSAALSEADVDDRALRAYFEDNPAEFTEVCAKHVLLDTPEAAAAVVAELRGGADLASVARAQSKDPSAQQNGGDLGCQPASRYVPAFRDATLSQPLDQVGEPVQTEFGWHVVVVSSRSVQPFAEVRDQIRQQLLSQSGAAVDEWLLDAVGKATISVNKKFGRFDRSPASGQLPRVVPPAEAATTTTTGQ